MARRVSRRVLRQLRAEEEAERQAYEPPQQQEDRPVTRPAPQQEPADTEARQEDDWVGCCIVPLGCGCLLLVVLLPVLLLGTYGLPFIIHPASRQVWVRGVVIILVLGAIVSGLLFARVRIAAITDLGDATSSSQ